jgi:hypothetical protein
MLQMFTVLGIACAVLAVTWVVSELIVRRRK